MRFSLAFLFCFVLTNCVFAQQNRYWYFGLNAGLNFNTPVPTILNNGLATNFDNSSTISDANGNLLFYTTGMNVWDKNHNLMPNGSGLIGNTTGGQCALIVPIPCDTSKYVIFHTTEFSNPGSLNYTLVDMTLNGGNGDVVASQKNISLGNGWTEKLCAYYNPTGNFYWVVSHKWNSDQFVAFKIDQTTIATNSVVSSIGSIHNCGSVGGAHDAMGQLTISPDGTKLINALTCSDKFELFDFDINTGVLSNLITIPGDGNKAWGTAFSSDSKKVYTNSIFGRSVFQYDINVYVQSTIVNSQFTLVTMPSTGYNFGYMEKGPDNKIYITRPNTNWLSVVNNPNLSGAASNFVLNGQSLGTSTSRWGLSRIAYNIQSGGGQIVLNINTNSVSCFGLSDGSATITPSPSTTYSYSWTPSVSSTSVASNLAAGSYTVKVSDGICLSTTSVITIIQPPKVVADFSPIVNQCKGTVNANNLSQGANSYTWNLGNNSFIYQPNLSYTYSLPGTYTITLFAMNNNCIDSIKKSVNIVQSVQSAFSFTSNICDSTVKFQNNSSSSSNYLWSFGDGNFSNTSTISAHTYSLPGTYTISLIADPGGICPDTSRNVVNLVFNSQANFSLIANYCNKDISVYNISQNSFTNNWYFGDGYSSMLVNPTHTYVSAGTFSVMLIINKGTNCADTMIKKVDFGSPPIADFTYTINPCTGNVKFTNSSINSGKFHWNFNYNGSFSNDTNTTFTFPQSGKYKVMLIANPGLYCADTVFKDVHVQLDNVTADFDFEFIQYKEEISFINKSNNASVFLWDFNDGFNSNLKNPTHPYQGLENFKVCLSAKNQRNCGDTICKDLKVKPEWTLYVPNSFTPNKDGVNDVFLAFATNIKEFKIEIFNRWGEKLYFSNDINIGWSGEYKGKIAQDDVYVWKIQFVDLFNKTHEKTGHVLLYK